MAEENIMLAENDSEYTLIDVVEAAKNMGLNSTNVQTLRNFLILNDDYFDSDDYADFIDIINEIRELYYNPVAEELFGKTADKLTEAERYDVMDAMSNEVRRAILDAHIEAMRDHGTLASMEFDPNGHVVWYWSLRGASASTSSISYNTEHGTAPDPVEGLTVTEEHLPTITADGYVHTGWVDYIGDPVEVGQVFSYSPTLVAVWEEAPTTVDYTITYETTHGTAQASKIVTVNEGEAYALTETDLPALTADGYLFGGWSVHGEVVLAGHEISADIVLTAVWEEVPEKETDPDKNWFAELFINEAKPAMQRHSGGDTAELAAQIAEQAATISQQASTIEDLNEDLETANSTITTKTSELDAANTTISEQSTQITELETWKSENAFASEFWKYKIQMTNMSGMFNTCTNLTSVPLFDTSKVTIMSSMFTRCTNLTSVPLFDTSNVTNMSGMFANCTKLTSVPLFDTPKVMNTSSMFSYCTNLTSVPLFDTSNVTSMNSMFCGCTKLTSVPLFDTSNVTNTGYMFSYCTNLTSVPLFDTSNVTNMSYMFERCTNLTSVPRFDTSNVTGMSSMFERCTNLTDCYLRNIKTNLQVGFGTSYGHLLTLDSLKHLIYELRDTGSLKTLTVGSANLAKLADVYVKLVDITDEMRAEDDLIDEKLPYVVCESTDEGAMLITNYVAEKHWTLK